MNKTFIFDLDDTLMYNLHDYSEPILNFVKFVVKKIGPKAPDIPTIVNLQAEIDSKKVKEWMCENKGFSKERFPTSLAETYREIGKPLGINDPEGEEKAYEIGTQAFSMRRWKEQGLVPGALKTIKYLKSKKDELLLMTKGDLEIQTMKIKANKLESVFGKENIFIVPTKNKEELYKVIQNRKIETIWHIGNSIKSDILPAIEANIGAIYIPLETWAFEKEHKPLPEYKRLFKLNSLEEIKFIYNRLL